MKQLLDKDMNYPIGNNFGTFKNRYSENILTPVRFFGLIKSEGPTEFKLICSSGTKYSFICNEVWKETLTKYCMQEVKVIGLLNATEMTLIPQKILPIGPTIEVENIVDIAAIRTEQFLKKFIKGIKKQITIPARFCA